MIKIIIDKKLKKKISSLKRNILDLFTAITCVFGSIYMAISAISFIGGLAGANHYTSCLSKPNRIEKWVPSYELGCYLFGTEGKPYYGEQNE
jgi:hypothetical protein